MIAITRMIRLSEMRLALAARLTGTATVGAAARVFVREVNALLEGAGACLLMRDRRSDDWSIVASQAAYGEPRLARLFTDPESRDPLEAVERLARPIRPWRRLAGGVVVYRPGSYFSRAEGSLLGRLTRVFSAELERRDRIAREATANRLFRRVAAGVRPVDVVYHALDAAVRLTASDHSATVLARPGEAAGGGDRSRWSVVAEKLCRRAGPSPRIGWSVEQREPGPDVRGLPPVLHTSLVELPKYGPRALSLVVRCGRGDRYDRADREALLMIGDPVAHALRRVPTAE